MKQFSYKRKFDYSNSEIPMYYNYDESVNPNNKDVQLFTKTYSHYAKSSLYFPLGYSFHFFLNSLFWLGSVCVGFWACGASCEAFCGW